MAAKNDSKKAMVGEEILIDPEMAAQFLDLNMPNRSISPKTVKKYVDDINNGTWRRSPQPICFDTNGKLIDGQHRLTAIVLSGKAQPMVVMRNCPIECTCHLDSGRARSVVDRIRIGNPEMNWVTNRATSIVNLIHYCWSNYLKTQDEMTKYLEQHKDSFYWLSCNYKAREHGFTKAPIRGAIMLAYENAVDETLLRDICLIMDDDTVTAKYSPIANTNLHYLKTYLKARAVRFNSGGGENKTVLNLVAHVIRETTQGHITASLECVPTFCYTVTGIDGEVIYAPQIPGIADPHSSQMRNGRKHQKRIIAGEK